MAYNIDTLKTILNNLLPDNSKLKISIHREANTKMVDFFYIPFGVPFPYLGTTVPSNCCLCNGAEYNISDYPYLYSEIGNTYNTTGDGVLTFNVPNIPAGGSIIQAGTDQISETTFTLATTGGNVTHTNTKDEMVHHNHTVTVGMSNSGSGDWNLDVIHVNASTNGAVDYTNIPVGVMSYTGKGDSYSIMNPFIVGNWIMRLK